MQLSLTTIPVAANFTQLFSRRRKKNRVEFIADFPENDDAEVVSSLQVSNLILKDKESNIATIKF